MRHPFVRLGVGVAAAAAVATLTVYLAFWLPAEHAHQALIADIDVKRKGIVTALHAHDVVRAYNQAQKILPSLERKLENAGGQSDLVNHLEKLARKRGVKILSESYEEGKSKGPYAPLHLDIALQGGYPALRAFLRDIPALPAWGEIQELRLERSREGAGQIRAQMRLVTYRRTADKAAERS